MIRKLYNSPHILYQSTDVDDDVPNEALGVCIDNGGTIVLHQGGSEIVISKATVPELCKLLRKLASVS